MKKINELTIAELKIVFENNSTLEEQVFADMFDNATFWCDEYLQCWKNGIDYCIGYDRDTYFKCTDIECFLDGLKIAQRTFGFLDDKYNDLIAYAETLADKMNYLYYHSSEENYHRVETRLLELIETLETACYKRFLCEYEDCFNDEYQIDYFINHYVDCHMDDTFYIDEYYNLFQHIEYEKAYK